MLIGGRGSILGPLLGTLLLTLLPEVAAPLVAWSTFLYAALLLVIVLAIPGGIAALIDFAQPPRRCPTTARSLPRPELLPALLGQQPPHAGLMLRDVVLAFGGVRAIDGLDLDLRAGRGAWADRPERQRQDHDAERHLRLLPAGDGRR